MKSWFSRARARLSFANVTSTLALFLALGGTSYAAATLPTDSVGKGQIKSNAVGKSEIASNSVGTSELRNSGVAAADIKSGAVGPSEVRPNAIDSDELADGGIGAADLSDAAKTAVAGLNAVTFRASAARRRHRARRATPRASPGQPGVYNVDLGTRRQRLPARRRRSRWRRRGRARHGHAGRHERTSSPSHVRHRRRPGRPGVQLLVAC